MPIPDPNVGAEVIPGPGNRPVSAQGRAYCGPAHGAQWPVTDGRPPAWVELPCGTSSALYRLVRHPRTGRPARDILGNLLYVPMVGDHSASHDDTPGRVIPFPIGRGRDGSTRAR